MMRRLLCEFNAVRERAHADEEARDVSRNDAGTTSGF